MSLSERCVVFDKVSLLMSLCERCLSKCLSKCLLRRVC